jgi:aryl-alcohol dehydrogenase-like predicted oxidoreductase
MKNKIALGTVQFGVDYGISNHLGQTSLQEVGEILNLAYDLNIDTIDTASAYGNSEENLGEFDLNNFNIVTKFLNTDSFHVFSNEVQRSFEKLKQQKIYSIMAHRPLSLIQNDFILPYLNELKINKKLSKIGASFNTIEEIEILLEKQVQLDIIQVPYNILDQRFEKYMIELHQKGCEIHTRSCFLQGLFFCDVNSLIDFFNPIKKYLLHLQNNYKDLSQQLLLFCLSKDFIDKVVIGVNNKNQLISNLEKLDSVNFNLPNFTGELRENLLIPSMWPKN